MRLFLFLFCAAILSAEMPMMQMGSDQKIGVQNAILAKVNGTTISMMGVKKKMDLLFHQNYPHLLESNQARFQYYQASWRHVLMEMIDQELILADAADREIKLSDGEVREEVENRFGPSIMATLDKIGLSYDEAWKMIKNDMLVRRMTWWFIQSKAMAQVTPQEIRQSYRQYLQSNPSYVDCVYQIVTVRGAQLSAVTEELQNALAKKADSPEAVGEFLQQFESAHPGTTISISSEYRAKDIELSDAHRSMLSATAPQQYSQPLIQTTRDKQEVGRIFYVAQKTEHPAQSFDEMVPLLKNELLQKASGQISQTYIEKLRKHYRFDADHMNEALPEDMQPFTLQ